MFSGLNLHGGKADVLWHHHKAIVLKHWRVRKRTPSDVQPNGVQRLTGAATWELTGVPERIEAFMSRQRPLLLAVPRAKGFFLWPIEKVESLGSDHIRARLGPPEQ